MLDEWLRFQRRIKPGLTQAWSIQDPPLSSARGKKQNMKNIFILMGFLSFSLLVASGNQEVTRLNIRKLLVDPGQFADKEIEVGGICKISLEESLISDSREQLDGGVTQSVVKLSVPLELLRKLSVDSFSTLRGPFIIRGTFSVNPVASSKSLGEIKVLGIDRPIEGQTQLENAVIEEAKEIIGKHASGGDVDKEEMLMLIESLIRRIEDAKR